MALPTLSVDPEEIAKFSAIADEWWNEQGKFKPLHLLNPVRIKYIKDKVTKHFKVETGIKSPLQGLKFIDVGCGGGLLTIPLNNLGADIIGIDASEKNIKVAEAYRIKREINTNIRFSATSVEEMADSGEKFDVVLAMEVIEHVADVDSFLASCIKLLKPNGLIFIATLNRTFKSYLFAIVGAEYILRWLPKGTHAWDKFLLPSEINQIFSQKNIDTDELIGVKHNPLLKNWALSQDVSVNYMIVGINKNSDDS